MSAFGIRLLLFSLSTRISLLARGETSEKRPPDFVAVLQRRVCKYQVCISGMELSSSHAGELIGEEAYLAEVAPALAWNTIGCRLHQAFLIRQYVSSSRVQSTEV